MQRNVKEKDGHIRQLEVCIHTIIIASDRVNNVRSIQGNKGGCV